MSNSLSKHSEVSAKKAEANKLHSEVLALAKELNQKWFTISSKLIRLHDEQLWREIDFWDDSSKKFLKHKSWGEYLEISVGFKVQTINNFFVTYRGLKDAGLKPAELADIPMNRAQELAPIARANAGKVPEEILTKARAGRNRKAAAAFHQAIKNEKEKLALETREVLRIPLPKSLMAQWKVALQVFEKLETDLPAGSRELLFIEKLIGLYFTSEPGVEDVLRSMQE